MKAFLSHPISLIIGFILLIAASLYIRVVLQPSILKDQIDEVQAEETAEAPETNTEQP